MNISELARRLRATPDEIKEKLPLLGFDVGHKAIKIDDRLVNKVMEKWSEMKKLERLKQKYAQQEKIKEEAKANARTVELPKAISVRDFAAKMSLPLNIVIGELMKNGILASLNERIDFETASIVAEDLGYGVTAEGDKDAQDGAGMSADELKSMLEKEDQTLLAARPPVVVVMGHVDHGKTSLLDAVRKTNVLKGEAGGITQHIGAYQVEHARPSTGAGKKAKAETSKLTFIDTPGHEAFTVMRSRGARVADVAILVVASDDGVQPQTVEVIKIINAAKLPFVVALTKADKPGLDPNRVKTQLAEQGVQPEEWGGKVPFVAVSSKTGQGLDELLETILLVAEIEKDKIRANPDRRAVGTVIESHIDKGEGPVATVLVQSGTLKPSDELEIGGAIVGRVRAMKDWNGQPVREAAPGMPVKILGFKSAPQMGDIAQVPEEGHDFKAVKKQHTVERQSAVVSVSNAQEGEENATRPTLKIILKTDALGSLEAIMGSVEKMKTPEVAAAVVAKGLGNIVESDVLRAEATGGVVMGFNIVATREAQILARDKKVEIKVVKVIYEMFDDIERRLQALLPVEVTRTDLGKLEVLAVFRSDKTGQVIGGRVIDGHLEPGANVVVYRGQDPVDEGKILTLQSGKQEVKEVRMGQECGLKVSCRRPALVGDIVHVFKEDRKERKLVLPK